MNLTRRGFLGVAGGLATNVLLANPVKGDDPLPSWNDGRTKSAILDFVARTTKVGGSDFLPVSDRLATFDNDGTLWCEMPMYVQLVFAMDRVRKLAPQHPEWKEQQPFKAVLENDLKAALATTKKDTIRLILSTHTGMTVDQFETIVTDWMTQARHPRFKRPYTECVYQPMLELLAYLRASGYKTFIVSGGGIEFMRPWTDRVYGIPTEQVVGSTIKTRYEVRNGTPILERLPAVNFVDDGPGKPVGINSHIGRRPVMAFGNSDGDFEMLEYTTAGKGPRFGLIVHHTDAEREYAYDRNSPIGRLNRGLDEAPKRGWVLADMKRDWKKIFPFET